MKITTARWESSRRAIVCSVALSFELAMTMPLPFQSYTWETLSLPCRAQQSHESRNAIAVQVLYRPKLSRQHEHEIP